MNGRFKGTGKDKLSEVEKNKRLEEAKEWTTTFKAKYEDKEWPAEFMINNPVSGDEANNGTLSETECSQGELASRPAGGEVRIEGACKKVD